MDLEASRQLRCRLDRPIVWTLELVCRIETSEDKIAHVVDHWLDQIIGGFITKFAVNTLVSYCETKRRFLKGPQGKYIKSLNTWIKILLCVLVSSQDPFSSKKHIIYPFIFIIYPLESLKIDY